MPIIPKALSSVLQMCERKSSSNIIKDIRRWISITDIKRIHGLDEECGFRHFEWYQLGTDFSEWMMNIPMKRDFGL